MKRFFSIFIFFYFIILVINIYFIKYDFKYMLIQI